MDDVEVLDVRRKIRVVAILAAADRAGLAPMPASQLHTIAYFADALAPVWDLRILDSQRLKQDPGPMSPELQRDIDELAGRGVVTVTDVTYVSGASGRWRVAGNYVLNSSFGSRILDAIERFPETRAELGFVSEVVYAVSGLGDTALSRAPGRDAAYGSEVIDEGELIDFDSSEGTNPTARVAMRIGELMRAEVRLAPAEMIHLYVRELQRRLESAA